MSRLISVTDLITYGLLAAGAILLLIDWAQAPEFPLGKSALFAAIIAHHAWSRATERQRVERISAVVVERHLRDVGEGVRRITKQ